MAAVYNATKAAILQYSETLRLELQPLHVRVLTSITGQVATNLPQPPNIDEESIYQPLESALTVRAKQHMGT
jgi:1-acylglycerone phosphate reductase